MADCQCQARFCSFFKTQTIFVSLFGRNQEGKKERKKKSTTLLRLMPPSATKEKRKCLWVTILPIKVILENMYSYNQTNFSPGQMLRVICSAELREDFNMAATAKSRS